MQHLDLRNILKEKLRSSSSSSRRYTEAHCCHPRKKTGNTEAHCCHPRKKQGSVLSCNGKRYNVKFLRKNVIVSGYHVIQSPVFGVVVFFFQHGSNALS